MVELCGDCGWNEQDEAAFMMLKFWHSITNHLVCRCPHRNEGYMNIDAVHWWEDCTYLYSLVFQERRPRGCNLSLCLWINCSAMKIVSPLHNFPLCYICLRCLKWIKNIALCTAHGRLLTINVLAALFNNFLLDLLFMGHPFPFVLPVFTCHSCQF